MNFQQLQYVLAIAQTGSISKAAEKLYKSQPNISTAIKELEDELHIKIFERSFHGVCLTKQGEQLVQQATQIVEQMQTLQEYFTHPLENTFTYKISISRSSYLTIAIANWINTYIQQGSSMHITLQETSTSKVIDAISSGSADVGIIRIPSQQQSLYDALLDSKGISQITLIEFPLRIVFKTSHPLAHLDIVPYEMLQPYTEIIHGDDSIVAIQNTQIKNAFTTNKKRKIYVYDRGTQINLLETIQDAYMWVSPIPSDMLKNYDMLIKDCSLLENKNKDILIFKNEMKDNATLKHMIASLQAFIQKI